MIISFDTLSMALLIASARVILGLFIGLAAGWFEGKWFDRTVMGIIGVLMALLFPALAAAKRQMRKTELVHFISNLRIASKVYLDDNGIYRN